VKILQIFLYTQEDIEEAEEEEEEKLHKRVVVPALASFWAWQYV
jgi:hypothetical protein